MARCADCVHVYDEKEPEDDEPSHRCGYRMPFWVPLPISDYRSWVKPDDGENCQVFEPKSINK